MHSINLLHLLEFREGDGLERHQLGLTEDRASDGLLVEKAVLGKNLGERLASGRHFGSLLQRQRNI